jgi:hypothetical protein
MPARSKIAQLPPDVRARLDKKLVAGGFAGYENLEEWLTGEGYAIGKSSIHRYGQNLESKLAAVKASTEAARAIAEAAPDDADLRSAAAMSLVQTEIFNVMVALQEAGDEDDPAERLKLMARAAKPLAELSRASVNQKKWEAEVKTRVSAAAEAAAKIAKKGGLSSASVDEIRRSILGIAT